jgi:hypothetical protein
MRKLSAVTANILPQPIGHRSFARRRVRAVFDSLTCLVLVKHSESATEIFVSDDGDAVGAIWIHKAPLLVDPKDRGPFIVVTMTRTMAQQKGLAPCILDWDRYTPAERVLLKDAIETARRSRERMSGHSSNRPTWSGGRNVYQ